MIEEFGQTPSANYGGFKEVMSKFTPTSKKLVEKIEELMDKGEKLFKEIVAFFGEPATSTLEEFFGELNSFSVLFERTRTEMIRKRELEARQRQRLEQQEKQKQQQQNKMPMGRLEQALADLTSGNAFTPNRKPTNYQNKPRPSVPMKNIKPFQGQPQQPQPPLTARPVRGPNQIDQEQQPSGPSTAPVTPRHPISVTTPRTPRVQNPQNVQKDQLAAALAFLKKDK